MLTEMDEAGKRADYEMIEWETEQEIAEQEMVEQVVVE